MLKPNHRIPCRVSFGLLGLFASTLACAEVRQSNSDVTLRQNIVQLTAENHRLKEELKRLQLQLQWEQVRHMPIPANPWLFMTEQYGLPIVGY
jgi:hypothetical protein